MKVLSKTSMDKKWKEAQRDRGSVETWRAWNEYYCIFSSCFKTQ